MLQFAVMYYDIILYGNISFALLDKQYIALLVNNTGNRSADYKLAIGNSVSKIWPCTVVRF